MTAKTRVFAAAGVIAGSLVLGWALLQRQGLTRLTSSPAALVRQPLPDGTVILRAAEAATITAPLVRQSRQAKNETNDILVLTDRGGADNNSGRAELPFHVPRPGAYSAWIRARWDNACGNSVLLHADDGKDYTAGEDDVFNVWHWIRAGRHTLAAGEHRAVLAGREDGIAVDELLFTPDASFVPAASAFATAPIADLRRAADNFDRSPGHGLEPWQAVSGRWDIIFTLDPNRIPDQYALTGRPGTNGEPALAVLQGDPWEGVRLAFSFSPNEPGESGVLLGRGADGPAAQAILFQVSSNSATLRVEGPEGVRTRDLGDRVRLGQWHRVVVERWAWLLRVSVDGHPVFTDLGPLPAPGSAACCVRSGTTAFDDVSVEEVPWQAEGDGLATIPWAVAADARWDRAAPARGGGLIGRNGNILAGLDNLPVYAVLLDDGGGADCQVASRKPAETYRNGNVRLLEPAVEADTGRIVVLTAGPKETRIRRVAIAYGSPAPDLYVEGPYHFTSPLIDDPSDYLDFSPEELRETAVPGQADKLRRRPKTFRLVGRGQDKSAWVLEGGQWNVSDGSLAGLQPGLVKHWRDITVSLEMRGRIRLDTPASSAGFGFYADTNRGVQVRLGPGAVGEGMTGGTQVIALPVPADGAWHAVRVKMDGSRLTGAVDDRDVADCRVSRGTGGALRLAALAGNVRFDDVEYRVPRAGPGEYFYAFDRRETDWWREGGPWIDHGGISCALTSHWISLMAPGSRGVLWNKRIFGSDLLVALTVEENTEWFGWDQAHSHVHYPYDNLCLLLAPAADWDSGYRLEVNARGRTETVLYRNGKPVASVAQDDRFPMRYHGGSQPYTPRRNRLALLREGSRVRALVNGVDVLTYDDPAPLPVSRVGVGGYNTHANFSHVEIRELPGSTGDAR